MKRFLRRFLCQESGAVTVDWVVLTAAMAVFGAAIVLIILTAATDPADSIGATLVDLNVEY